MRISDWSSDVCSSDLLENLSDIIRKRHQMQQKVRAMASEARASAWIVGALPVLLFGAMMVLNPDYASALFTDPRGKILLGAAICTEALGIFVMSRMAKFRSEEHTSELQSLMRISYAVFCLKKKKQNRAE